MHDPMIGRVLHGTIEIKRLIGKGGMGNVYEGWQEHLERQVAVKVMTSEHARNPMAAEYFIREAKQSSKLRHPNIIQIIDYGKEDDTTLFIAMEFVPGRTLSAIIKEEFPLSKERVANIMIQTLSALEEAHEKTVVHRDLKPDNLMIELARGGQDFVKVLDFGIAQSKAPGSQAGPLTQAGALVGTPQYMSPEQATGRPVDGRSDLFSMGVILYHMLTQQKPFRGKHVPQILMQVIQGEPPAPSAVSAELEVDPQLEAICLRAMKKDPALRYQSATEFRQAIEIALSGESKAAEPAAPPAQFIFKRSRKRSESEPEVARPASRVGEDNLSTVAELPVDPPQNEFAERPISAVVKRPEADPTAATQALHGGLASGSSEVVDVSQLFGGAISEVAPATPAVVAPSTPTPGLPGLESQNTAEPLTSFSLAALREDLVGEKYFVTTIVAHQRAHRRLDPEALSEVTAGIEQVIGEIAQKWNGHVHSRQGSFTTLIFGLPEMSPDDAFRAAQAALELRQRTRRLLTDDAMVFAFAIGQGELFCPGGHVERAAGAVLDSAADLAREVGDWEVMVDGDTLQAQLENVFKLGAPIGHGERALQGVLDVAKQPRAQASDIIGRDAEMATILGTFGRLGRGNGSLLVVTGEGGMGKSALIAASVDLAEQRGFLALRARQRYPAEEGIRDLQQQWLHDLARQYARSSDIDVLLREFGVPAENARVLHAFAHESLHESLEGAGTERGAFSASTPTSNVIQASMRVLFKVLGAQRAIVLVLDQIDRFEDELATYLHRWSGWLENHKVLLEVGLSVRPGAAFPNFPTGTTTIHLDPLDDAACRALLRSRLPKTIGKSLQARLARLSAGIPLHLDQLIRWAQKAEKVDEESAEAWLAKATDIRAILQMRLFEQPRAIQNVVALLATLGGEAPGEVVMDLSSDEWNVEEALQDLWQQGLIIIEGEEDDPYVRLSPPAFSSVVYEQLSRKARARAHERIAGYFHERLSNTRSGDPVRVMRLGLVKHLEALARYDEAREVLDGVIDESLRSFEFGTGRQYVTHAIELAEKAEAPPAELAALRLRQVRILESLGESRAASDLCRTIDRMKDLPERLMWEVRIELSRLWLESEDPDLVERVVRKVSNELAQASMQDRESVELQGLSVRSFQLLGDVYERQGRYVQAAKALLDAIEITERGAVHLANNPWGPRLIWEPLNQLGRVRLRMQELPGANQLFELALKVATDAGDTRGELAARANLSALFANQNRLDAAYRSLQTSLKLARRLGDMRSVAKLEHNRGLLLLKQRRIDLAGSAFETSLEISNDLDWREGIAMNASQIQALRDDDRASEFMKPR